MVFNVGPAIFDIAAASIYIAVSLKFWIAIIGQLEQRRGGQQAGNFYTVGMDFVCFLTAQ